MRATAAGWQIVYTPYARLLHFESATRGAKNAAIGHSYMLERWRRELARDPYYNPNLSLDSEDYSISVEGD